MFLSRIIRASVTASATALKTLGEIERGDGGSWIISNFSRAVIKEQSVTAHSVACDAARTILESKGCMRMVNS